MSCEHRRLALALLLSLLTHTLLLSLTFGGQGLGLPGFGFPWRDRRIEVADVRVVLVPTRVTAAEPAITSVAEPFQQASIEQPASSGTASAQPMAEARSKRNAVAGADPANAPLRADRPGDAAPAQIPEPVVTDVEPSNGAALVVPAAPSAPTSVIAAAPSASSPETVMLATRDAGDVAQERIDPEARERAVELAEIDPSERETRRHAASRQEAAKQEAARQEATGQEAAWQEAERQEAARQAAAQLDAQRQEAARVEAARVEAERQEAARQAAAQREVQRQEAARQEAARVEAARVEAERQEAARQAAAQLDAQRQEAARQEAARVEAARVEAERQEAARQAAAQREVQRQEAARQEAARVEAARVEAERQEAARQATARQVASRVEAEQEAAARREAVLQAIGRQLDEEAARREAASNAARLPNTLPLSSSTARRVRLWGRTDPNVELIQYAEAWALKIQFNTAVETVREVAKRPHTAPMVWVAIRSDGSVESVTFDVSSGVAEVDAAIRRIVESQRPYQAFPPALAREFDVIQIRRTWHFDTAIRLY